MSNDGARAAFVEAFFEVAGPKVKKVSVAIEVCQVCLFREVSRPFVLAPAPWQLLRGLRRLRYSVGDAYDTSRGW